MLYTKFIFLTCNILAFYVFNVNSISCPINVTHMPNPNDCSSFYLCDASGNAYLQKCPANTAYNVKLKVCDWLRNVDCRMNREYENINNEIFKSNCWPGANYGQNFMPSKNDCSQYYVCENGVPKLKRCPTGLNFNIQKGVCDLPFRTKCKIYNSNIPNNNNQAQINECVMDSVNIGGIGTKFITFQNKDDCSTYYTCNMGRKVLTYCPRGLNYNPIREGCDNTVPTGCKYSNIVFPDVIDIYEYRRSLH